MNTQSTVGQLVVERPSRARVFEKFGIDYCCGGKKPLDATCREKGIELVNVVYALGIADSEPAPSTQDWAGVAMTELADHIEQTHHAWLKTELPRLETLIEKVARVHGQKHPEMIEVHAIYGAFKAELEQHMQKEERILFPLIRQLEAAQALSDFHCGSVQNPITVMVHEHDNAGEALAKFRELTRGYEPPHGACNTYRAMLAGLAELEADMHQHVHKENNILFPRAIAREKELAS